MQTLGAIAHYDFNDPEAYSYEMAAMIMRRLGLSYEDMEQLCLRMIFNVTTNNMDDHVKNISFLMNRKGEWRLAPAYDLTYAYDPANRWLRAHQMGVNGKRSEITKDDILACAAVMDISATKCSHLIQRVQSAVSEFKKYAENSFLTETTTDMIASSFLFLV